MGTCANASSSVTVPEAASAAENRAIAQTRRLLGAYDRAELMIQAGLYARGSDPVIDNAIRAWPGLDAFLAEDAPPSGVAGSFERLESLLAAAQARG